MSNDTKKISNLIKTLNSSVEFYKEAAKEVDKPTVATTLQNMALTHSKNIATLQPFVRAEDGESEDGSSFAVDMRKQYASVMDSIKSDGDLTYISQLEEVEDKLLEQCKDVLDSKLPVGCVNTITKVQQDIRFTHDRMKALQETEEQRQAS